MTKSFVPVLLLAYTALAQTNSGASHTKSTTASKPRPRRAAVAAAPTQTFPTDPGLYAAFNTSEGRIVVTLYDKQAPVTVQNFVSLAKGTKEFTDPKTGQRVKRPFYNGLTFHRVIPGFMIQGGDPTGTGMGDGGLKPIPDEFDTSLKFDQKGRLAMANAGPKTGTCQFFITDSTPEYLNGKHTIFGQVIEGQEVVTKIAGVPRDAQDKPRTPVVIKSVVIKRVGAAPASSTPKRKAAAKS